MEAMNFSSAGTLSYEDTSKPFSDLPIVVDLDNTLLLTDTLYELVAIGLFSKPMEVLFAAPRILKGKAALKTALAGKIDLSSAPLPFREDLVDWLRVQSQRGREIHLCSAAAQPVVDTIAERLDFFSSAVGTADANLKGRAKATYLANTFPEGFVYAGDSRADLPVWKAASGAVLAGVSDSTRRAARDLGKPIEAEFENAKLGFKGLLKALRVHHWSKNFLMFLPLILGHAWSDWPLILSTLIGFVCLLAVTSATYLLNDIADLEADRRHWSKINRALASGLIPISTGFALSALGLIAGLGVAMLLSLDFALALSVYLVLTLAYSLGLKRVPLLDTLIIGLLFTTRLIMGVTLFSQSSPAWLLTFSVFFFVSLAIAKRHAEIVRAAEAGSRSISGRGYTTQDAPITLSLGISTAVASLVVLVLFIVEEMLPGNVYGNPQVLAGMPLILSVWLGRIWLLAHRGQMNDDPVSFALRDKPSLLLGVLVAAVFLIAL